MLCTACFHGFTFYRATLCVSAVFAVARCPSVKLVHCIHMAKDIVKLLSRPDSPIILVFSSVSGGTQFQGKFLHQGRKIHGVGKCLRF